MEVALSRSPESVACGFDAFSFMRRQGILVDVRLVPVGGNPIPAHRLVLSSVSPFFQSMFTLDLRESREKDVQLRDIDHGTLSAVVAFCYGEEVRVAAGDRSELEESLLQLLAAADRLQITELFDSCTQSLIAQLRPENVLELREFAEVYRCTELAQHCTLLIHREFTAVVRSDEFVELSLEGLLDLVSSDYISVPREELVYEAVMRWIHHDLQDRRDKVADILSHVRFPFVSPHYLQDVIERDELLRDELFCQGLIQEAHYYKKYPEKRADLQLSPRSKPRRSADIPEVLLVAGGACNKGSLGSVVQYSSDSNQWTVLADMPGRCYGMGACVLGGCLYMVGGHSAEHGVLSSTYRYNLKDGVWSQVASMGAPRRYLSVAAMCGLIYATGGHNGDSVTSSVEFYNPEADQWSQCTSMNEYRMYHSTVEAKSHLFSVGGHNGSKRLQSVECYNPCRGQWSSLAPMSIPRSVAGVATFCGSIYVAGGYSDGQYLSSVEVYDLELHRWSPAPPMSSPRSAFGLEPYMGTLHAVGGFNGVFVSSSEQFVPSEGKWIDAAQMPVKMAHFGIAST